jgi:hypothetical protein
VGRDFGFSTSLWLVNRLGTTLQHLFNARVTKVAGFLRPTSPWLYGRSPRCPAEALRKESLKKGDLVRTLKDQSAVASMVPENVRQFRLCFAGQSNIDQQIGNCRRLGARGGLACSMAEQIIRNSN